MKTLLRRSKSAQYFFQFVLVFSFLVLGASSSWAIVVTNTNDSGAGSLRAAITTANGDGVATTITFDAAVFPATIFPVNQLPALTGAGDTIDGTGSGVVIDGSGTVANGLRIRRSNITVRGLRIQNFTNDGIQVDTQGPSAVVTGVLITGNTLLGNGNRGIRVSGGSGPGKTVSAAVTNNTLFENVRGITVHGNLFDIGQGTDPGGNTVTVLVDGNTVKRSNQGLNSNALFAGDGIQIVGGIGDGSNNVVTATVSNNDVKENRDDGIVVLGCGLEDAGSNNTVYARVINNVVENNGLKPILTTNHGIVVAGASGENGTDTTCDGNEVWFEISNNDSKGNATRNIQVSGGTGTGHDLQGIISGNLALGVTPQLTTQLDGILVSGGVGDGHTVHDVTITGNTTNGNLDRGINISGGAGTNATVARIEVYSNISLENGNHGIQANGGTGSDNTVKNVLISENTSMRNTNEGISLTVGTGTNNSVSVDAIRDNETNSNGRDGIGIRTGVTGSATPVSGNRADRNGQDGIDIDATGYVLSNNTASRNIAAGIDAVGNTNGGGNKAVGNASCNTPGCF